MRSLSARLLLSLFILLLVFFGVTIAALDLVFRDLSERSLRELLDAQVLALISASDVDARGGISAPAALLDTRYASPGSGLYAEIRDSQGVVLWRSPSAIGTGIGFGPPVVQGQRRYETVRAPNGDELAALSAGYHWEIDSHTAQDYVFSVAASLEPSRAQLARFRTQLFVWFTGLAVLLLISLAVLMRRLLAPLRKVAREIRAVEAGELAELGAGYPAELEGVTQGLNALLKSERQRMERYRNTLGNLAHSLKTPLAIMRSVLGEDAPVDGSRRTLAEQAERMDAIVQHQLKRSTASGGATLGQTPVAVMPILSELRVALLRVYGQKDLTIRIACEPEAEFLGDRGDLLELLGNLVDNACKYCRDIVTIEARIEGPGPARLRVFVDDDGPGVPAGERARILERGVRVDESTTGQGLGLSMTRDIVEQYRGRLTITESPLGGARFDLQLPGTRSRSGRVASTSATN
jgi:two-component system sensor histidine kinase PhoQ